MGIAGRRTAAGVVLGLALSAVASTADAIGPPPTLRLYSVHLPVVLLPGRVTPAAPTATPRPTATPGPAVLRPTTYEELRRAVAIPGAYVVPAPGIYRPSRNLKIGPGVTLDGADQVTILGKTVELYQADHAVVRRLAVRDAAGDGIRVSHTSAALIERVRVSGSKDGEIDVVEIREDQPAVVIVRDSVIGPGRKCFLGGDPDQPQDARLTIVLERVRFEDCRVRVPKAHWVYLEMRDSTIYNWSGPRIDAQLGARVRIKGNTWIAGPESLPGFYLPTGGQVEDLGGNTYREWRGAE